MAVVLVLNMSELLCAGVIESVWSIHVWSDICRYLNSIADSSAPIAIPMRMLEIFLSPSTYSSLNLGRGMDTHKLLSQLLRNLVNAGGYSHCCCVLIVSFHL